MYPATCHPSTCTVHPHVGTQQVGQAMHVDITVRLMPRPLPPHALMHALGSNGRLPRGHYSTQLGPRQGPPPSTVFEGQRNEGQEG